MLSKTQMLIRWIYFFFFFFWEMAVLTIESNQHQNKQLQWINSNKRLSHNHLDVCFVSLICLWLVILNGICLRCQTGRVTYCMHILLFKHQDIIFRPICVPNVYHAMRCDFYQSNLRCCFMPPNVTHTQYHHLTII